MMPFNSNWEVQTFIFTAVFLAAVLISTRRKNLPGAMSKEASNELRGLAILGILFAHLTYGKFWGTDFLFPLGIWAGPAVNLFFFLSGYGLAASAIYHAKSLKEYYLKRVAKIYLPLWIFLIIILLADFIFLQRAYPWTEIFYSFLGYFPTANLYTSINSPLWFLTPLLFYYIVFPWIFRTKHPRLSVLAVFLVSYIAFWPGWPVSEQVLKFYQSHWLAFPLGVMFAALVVSPENICAFCVRCSRCLTYKWVLCAWVKGEDTAFKPLSLVLSTLKSLDFYWRFLILAALAALAWQTAYHSGVGKGIWIEQEYALFTMLVMVLFFAFKKSKFRLLEIFGAYSFEVYLWHWPLISRYDIFYEYLPPWLATVLYLPLLLLIAFIFNRLAVSIGSRLRKIFPR